MSDLTHQTRAKFIDIGLMAVKRFHADLANMDSVIFAMHAVGIKPTIINEILDDVMNVDQQDRSGVAPQHTRSRSVSAARRLLPQLRRAATHV